MKLNLIVVALTVIPFAHASADLIIEEALRATPPGATDLVPRMTPSEVPDREPLTYRITGVTYLSDYTPCYQPPKTDLFSPAKPIDLSSLNPSSLWSDFDSADE